MNNKKTKDSIWIGIGIDLRSSDNCYTNISQLNEILQHQYGSNYNFGPSNPLHINLYDIDIPEDNLEKVRKSLKQIANRWKSFPIKLASIDSFKHGAIYIKCELNDNLKQLEKEIVESVVNYLDGQRTEDYWQPWREYNQQQIDNRNKYGNPHVLDTFKPHITLGYVNKAKLHKAVLETKKAFVPTELDVKQIDMAIQNSNGEFLVRKHFKFS